MHRGSIGENPLRSGVNHVSHSGSEGGIMKRILVVLWVVLSAFAITDVSAWAQATGQLSGNVRDQGGAVLPGVEVAATQTDTGIGRSIITNETGGYLNPNLVAGAYRIEAALPDLRS